MKRDKLKPATVYAYRTSPRYRAQPVLLVSSLYLWRMPNDRHSEFRRDDAARKCESNSLYGDTGYLVVRPYHNATTADQLTALDEIAKVLLPLGELDDHTAAAFRGSLPDGMTFDVVNNAHLPGTWAAVAEADRIVREARDARRAEADAKARAMRDRFQAARETVKAAAPGLYSFNADDYAPRVDMTLDQFEVVAAALAELAEHRTALRDATAETRGE